MDTTLLGLPAEVGTALALIASGVIVPAVTSLLAYPGIPKWLKRFLPIFLSAGAAFVIVLLAGGGPLAEKLITWILVLAVVVGIAQTVYALMPEAWKKLEAASSPTPGVPVASQTGQERPFSPAPAPEVTQSDLSPQSGLERPVAESDAAPFRERGLHDPEGEDYTRS